MGINHTLLRVLYHSYLVLSIHVCHMILNQFWNSFTDSILTNSVKIDLKIDHEVLHSKLYGSHTIYLIHIKLDCSLFINLYDSLPYLTLLILLLVSTTL